LLVEHFSWSAVFWVNVPIGTVAVAVCLWAVAESRDERHRHLDVLGTGLVTAGLFALVFAVIGTNSHAWTSARTVGLLAVAAVLLAIFFRWEQRNADPMLPLQFFHRRAFATSTAVALLVSFAFLGVLYLLVIYLQNVKGYSPLQAGVRTLPLTLTQALTAATAGRLDRRLGARIKMSAGMLVLSIGLLGMAQIHVSSSYDAIWPFLVLLGLGMGMTIPAVSAAAMAGVDDDRSGIAAGVVNSARHVGSALGVAVLGSIVATLARADWHHQVSLLAPGTQAKATHLARLVLDGQGKVIGKLAGRPAQEAALESFVHGLQGALLTSSALAFIGSAVALVGLRQLRPGGRKALATEVTMDAALAPD
jgi:MFS family permease